MSAAEFAALLERVGACREAREWAHGKTAAKVWETCERGDWMLWLAGRLSERDTPERKAVVFAACDCAAMTLPVYERRYPGDVRPRNAIETARRYARGEALLYYVRSAAADAAYAADSAARTASLRECANIVRRYIPTCPIGGAT